MLDKFSINSSLARKVDAWAKQERQFWAEHLRTVPGRERTMQDALDAFWKDCGSFKKRLNQILGLAISRRSEYELRLEDALARYIPERDSSISTRPVRSQHIEAISDWSREIDAQVNGIKVDETLLAETIAYDAYSYSVPVNRSLSRNRDGVFDDLFLDARQILAKNTDRFLFLTVDSNLWRLLREPVSAGAEGHPKKGLANFFDRAYGETAAQAVVEPKNRYNFGGERISKLIEVRETTTQNATKVHKEYAPLVAFSDFVMLAVVCYLEDLVPHQLAPYRVNS